MASLNWSEIALAVLATLGAAISGWWAWIGKKSQTRDQQQFNFYTQVIAECQSLRADNTELKKQISELQAEVHLLRERLEFYEENPAAIHSRDMLEAVLNALPHPAWIHDLSNNKWYLNDKYCHEFGVTRSSFWAPVNIFGRYHADDAMKYAKHDMEVIEVGATIEFTERIRKRIMDPRCKEFVTGQFRKSPMTVGGAPYVMGEMLPLGCTTGSVHDADEVDGAPASP